MRRYLRPFAVNGPVAAWGYTRAMMIKRILTICAAVTAGAAASSLALAQGYPVPPGSVYSTAPLPGGYTDYRRGPGEQVVVVPARDPLGEDGGRVHG